MTPRGPFRQRFANYDEKRVLEGRIWGAFLAPLGTKKAPLGTKKSNKKDKKWDQNPNTKKYPKSVIPEALRTSKTLISLESGINFHYSGKSRKRWQQVSKMEAKCLQNESKSRKNVINKLQFGHQNSSSFFKCKK